MKHAVIYARFSSNNQREESIEGQVRACTKYAADNNMTIVGVYADRALSGRTTDRPQYKLMLEHAKRNKFDTVLVWKNDRISRNRYDMSVFRAKLKQSKINLISITELIPDSAEGIILESVLDGMAEYYSINLAQNTLRGMNENALKCKYNGAPVQLGYYIDENKDYQIHAENAEIVKDLFQRYLSGETMTSLAEYNKRLNITPKSPTGIANLLSNEIYIGTYKFNDIIIEDGVPAIIDKDTFYKVQSLRKQNKRRNYNNMENYLLTGRITCGICGGTIRSDSGTSRSGKLYKYYNCINSRNKDHECNFKALDKEDLEKFVISQIKEIIMNDELINYIADKVIEVQDEQFEALELHIMEEQIEEKKKQIENIVNAISNGAYHESMNKQLSDLQSEINGLEETINENKYSMVLLEKHEVIAWMKRYKHENLEDSKIRSELVNTFINNIILDNETLTIIFNYTENNNKVKYLKDLGELELIEKEIVKTQVFGQSLAGSPCWIRTSDPSVNSRMLYR
jgi:site-specific DNA recombinase